MAGEMHVVGYDAGVFSAGAPGAVADMIAHLRECRLNVERALIDVAGINPGNAGIMPYYRVGEADFSITASVLINDTDAFWAHCINAAEVYIVFGWATPNMAAYRGLYMYAYIPTDAINFTGRSEVVLEEVTFRPSRPALMLTGTVTKS